MASLTLITCLDVEIIQRWIVSSADRRLPCTKVKIIETSMSIYAMYKSTIMPRLNAIAEILSDIFLVWVKTLVKFETQLWPWLEVKVIGLTKYFIDLSSDYLHGRFDGHCLKSFRNTRTFSIRYVWPWMKVKVNIINTSHILISEAVTVPRLMIMTWIVSEESLARDRHTHTEGRL